MIRTPQWALTVEKREALLVCFSRIRVSRHPVARQKTVSWEGAHYLSAHPALCQLLLVVNSCYRHDLAWYNDAFAWMGPPAPVPRQVLVTKSG